MARLKNIDLFPATEEHPEYFKEFLTHYNRLVSEASNLYDEREIEIVVKHGVSTKIPTNKRFTGFRYSFGRVDYVDSVTFGKDYFEIRVFLKGESVTSDRWANRTISVTGNSFKKGDKVMVSGLANTVSSVRNTPTGQVITFERKVELSPGQKIYLGEETITATFYGG